MKRSRFTEEHPIGGYQSGGREPRNVVALDAGASDAQKERHAHE
jgi:hypothetical protein